MHRKVNIIVTAGLTNNKLLSKLQGLIHCHLVKNIYLIRRKPLDVDSEKLVNINPPAQFNNSIVLYELWRLYKLCTIMFSRQIHILYAIQLIPHSFHTYICSILFRKPMILSVIGDDVHIYLKKRLLKSILKIVIKKASYITVLGTQSADIIRNTGFSEKKIIKILNYINEDLYASDNNQKKHWDLIFTGELVSIKSLNTLIEAFAVVSKKVPEVTLCIVGDGPEKNTLQSLSEKLGVMDKIQFIGRTNNVGKYLKQSKILVMTSKSEALPASAIEAAFYGMPTILPHVGDIPSLFKHNVSSLIYTPGNMDNLIVCILKLLKDKYFYSQLSYGAFQLKEKYVSQWNITQQPIYWEQILKNL